jgi:hypothetical protein
MHAAHHAASAQVTAGAIGTLAAEERVGHSLALLTEVDAHGRVFVGVAHAQLLAELAQELVGRVLVRVFDHPQHPLGLGVVGRQGALPVLHLTPLAVLEEGLGGDVEGAGVAEASPAHATA